MVTDVCFPIYRVYWIKALLFCWGERKGCDTIPTIFELSEEQNLETDENGCSMNCVYLDAEGNPVKMLIDWSTEEEVVVLRIGSGVAPVWALELFKSRHD